jgi:zinc protease
VREEGGLAYAVYSYANPARYGASFVVSAQTRTAEVPKVVEIMREELARMTREPVTERELKLAKDYLIGSFPLRFDTMAKLADVLGLVELYGLGLDYFTRYPKQIEQVTKDDVLRVAKQYLHPDRYALVVVANQAKANIRH